MKRGKMLVELIINKKNNEEFSDIDINENQLNDSNSRNNPSTSLIVLNGDRCYTESINFSALSKINECENNDMVLPEDLFANLVEEDLHNDFENFATNSSLNQNITFSLQRVSTPLQDPPPLDQNISYPTRCSNDSINILANDSTNTANVSTNTANASTVTAKSSIDISNAIIETCYALTNITNASNILNSEIPYSPTVAEKNITGLDPNNHNMNEGRKRKKSKEPSSWKRNINKRLRMEGKPYTGFSTDGTKKIYQDTPRPGRKMRPTCTKNNCLQSKTKKCSSFTEEQRSAIFCKFWSLNWDERKTFICGHVTKLEKQKNTVAGRDSRRKFTLKYRLSNGLGDNLEVCREMFINTLGIGYRMVQLWVKKSSFDMPDSSTLRSSTRRDNNEKTEQIMQFFTSLPKMPSHYNRKNSSKLYLEPVFQSVQHVYKLYCEKCSSESKEPVSRRKFREVMESQNISLFKLKKDQCNLCKSYEAKNIAEDVWKDHVNKKELARKHKRLDKKNAVAGTQITLEMDFQAVKLAPFTNANAFYYKTKLACHNFTIYDLQSKRATCYWFSEDQNNQLVASTFVSCVIDYLEKYCLTPERKDIVIYSDGCTVQTRNNIMANALLNFSMLHGVNIYQKYLEVGHTQMEVDSVHGCIERKLKRREIKLPSDYVNITKEARRNPYPYEALELTYTFFKNYTQPLRYTSIRPERSKNDPTVTDIKVIAYYPDGTIKVKLDFEGDYLMLPQRPKQLDPVQDYLPLYSERCKIQKAKWLHLQELKTVIPQDCHYFYDNLPYNN